MGILVNGLKVLSVFLLLLVILPVFPPLDVAFESWNFYPIPFEGALAPNNALDEAEILSSVVLRAEFSELKGPESMVIRNGFLYTGIHGGNIVRLDLKNPSGSPWENVVTLGQGHCEGQFQEATCGRPLGLHLDADSNLVVADASFGLLKVDLTTKSIITLVPSSLEIQGEKNKATNSLAIARDGTIFYTSSSTNFPLYEGVLEILSAGSGRLLKYDPNTNSSQVLLNGLKFANGVALSDAEDYVLVSDLGRNRILKYHLQGDLTEQVETFLDTPGGPDNIRNIGDDRFLVGIPVPLLPDQSDLIVNTLNRHPWVARFLVRIIYGLKMVPELIDQLLFPHEWLKKAAYWAGNLEAHLGTSQGYGLLIEVDGTGKIIKSWHDPSGNLPCVCEGVLHNGYIYIGSAFNDFVGRIKYNS